MQIGMSIKIKNGALYRAIARRGWTVKYASERLGVNYKTFWEWVSMRKYPKRLTDERRMILEDFTGCEIHEIFPDDMIEMIDENEAKNNPGRRPYKLQHDVFLDVRPGNLLAMSSAPQRLLTCDVTKEEIERNEIKDKLEAALTQRLTEREEKIMRLALSGETGEDIGRIYNLSSARIHQIEAKARRKLSRDPALKELWEKA